MVVSRDQATPCAGGRSSGRLIGRAPSLLDRPELDECRAELGTRWTARIGDGAYRWGWGSFIGRGNDRNDDQNRRWTRNRRGLNGPFTRSGNCLTNIVRLGVIDAIAPSLGYRR